MATRLLTPLIGRRIVVSMIDGDLFDKLARVGSIIRRNLEPFGGIQVGNASPEYCLVAETRCSS